MKYKFEFRDEESKSQLITEHSDKMLIEEQNITEGNFLIFEDSTSVSVEIDTLKSQLQTTQDAVDFLLLNQMPI